MQQERKVMHWHCNYVNIKEILWKVPAQLKADKFTDSNRLPVQQRTKTTNYMYRVYCTSVIFGELQYSVVHW